MVTAAQADTALGTFLSAAGGSFHPALVPKQGERAHTHTLAAWPAIPQTLQPNRTRTVEKKG